MGNLAPYFTRRLLDTLALADHAEDGEERTIHLRACRYYREILRMSGSRKTERLKVNLPVVLVKEHLPSAESVVADISTYGFKVRACSWLIPDTRFAVHFEGLVGIAATVVWQRDDWAGCSFLKPLHPALLEAAIALSRPELTELAQ